MSNEPGKTTYTATGGGSVGWYHVSWPLVTLTASPERLSLEFPGKTLSFAPEEVVSLEVVRPFPFIVRYLAVRHTQAGTAEHIKFGTFGGVERIMAGIKESGFVTRGGEVD